MPGPRIALFANQDNPQLAALQKAVFRANGQPLALDIRPGQDGGPLINGDRLCWGQEDFSNIPVTHILCTATSVMPTPPPVSNNAAHAQIVSAFYKEQEKQAAVYSFFAQYEQAGGLLVNPLSGAFLDHESKSRFYDKVRTLGLEVPRTLTTNDREAAAEFIKLVGQAVAKPAAGIGATRQVTEKDLADDESLAACPVLFQERIMGRTLRVHVVGNKVVLTLVVHSSGTVDSRTSPRSFEPIALAKDQQERLAAATRRLDMHYAAWDAVLTDKGRLVCLDANPGPYVLWVGEPFAGAVLEQLAGFLVAGALSGSVEEASEQVRAVTWH